MVHDWLENSRHIFNQSWISCTRSSRALRQLHVITSSCDWVSGLPVPYVIGQINYFGFWFYDTQLKSALCIDVSQAYEQKSANA